MFVSNGFFCRVFLPVVILTLCLVGGRNVLAEDGAAKKGAADEIVIKTSMPVVAPKNEALPSKDDDAKAKGKDNNYLADDGTVSVSGPSALGDDVKADDFFDAQSLVPQGEMSKQGPVKVDPRTQPASKFVIVTKAHEANSSEAKLVSAERAMSLGMYDSALTMFDDLSKKNNHDPRVLMGKAVSLQKLGRFDESVRTYEALEKLDPANLNVQINMLGLLSTRYPAVALRRLLDLYKDHTDDVGLTAQVAVAYAQAGDTMSAMRYFGIASSMEPDNAGHIYNMAIMADRSGDKEQAIKYYEKALEVDAMHGANNTIPRDAVYDRLAQIR